MAIWLTPGDSTIKQLINMYHTFAQALDNKKEVRIVFCDVSAAFDKVWHHRLLYKLECAGISGNLLKWFRNYLTGRNQKVVIQGQSSSGKAVGAGVPQGSVLGPLLFLIFINDISEIVKSEIRIFADDTTLFVVGDDIDVTTTALNNDLNSLQVWANQWLVTFNPSKTKSLLISTKTERFIPPVIFSGEVVSEVRDHKHLGLVLASDLTWNKHIDEICLKATKRLDMLRGLKCKLSWRSLEIIYNSFALPILEYGDIIYYGCGVGNDIKLNKVQYDAAKIVSGAMYGTSSEKLLQELGWETLSSRRERHKLCLFYELLHGDFPPHLSSILPEIVPLDYTLRSSLCHTNRFYNSFIPSCVRLWNALDPTIKNSLNISSFKTCLLKNIPSKPCPYYYYGPRASNINLTRLRLNCSPLNEYLFKIGVLESPLCRCGDSVETTKHYFLECALYAMERITLHNALSTTGSFNLQTILYGGGSCNTKDDKNIIEAVYKYINDTGRFN